MKFNLTLKAACMVFALASLFTACKKNEDFSENSPASTIGMRQTPTEFYSLTSSNELVKYRLGNPLTELSSMMITGLQSGENMLAIDFRPATGQLYGVSNQSRIYTINLNNGFAYPLGAAFSPAISGPEVGFDFNPTVDRIRLTTGSGQNLRLNPETGQVVAVDVNLNPAGTIASGVAYTNSFAGATTTTLYDIDVATDMLYMQSPPNNGTLVAVGALGVNATGEAGFDISADNNTAIAALFGRETTDTSAVSNGNKYRFYTINLATGEAKNAGKTDRQIIGLAIPTMPVAYAVSSTNQLHILNPVSGSVVTKAIVGLDPGEVITGIDMRPASAQLYALGMNSKIYTINLANGAATAVSITPFSTLLSGTSFGFDFNPTVDRIRVVSNTGQNLRINPVTGAIAAVDPALNPGTPQVDAVAYINSFPGATTTVLYDIDVMTDSLYQQSPANAGTLINGKPLMLNAELENGFDIGGTTNAAWAILTSGNQSGLYNIDLMTGAATFSMPVPSGVKGFAIGLGF